MAITASFPLSELLPFDKMYGRLLSVVSIGAPQQAAVDPDTVKAWLRIDPDDASNDTVINIATDAATTAVEQYTGRALITQERAATYSAGKRFALQGLPIQSVDTVQVYDDLGALTTLANTEYVLYSDTGVLDLTTFAAWGVRIEYTCGYGGDSSLIPSVAKQAILRYIANNYEMREDNVLSAIGTVANDWRKVAQPIKIYAI
jgi:uncharacterized phiE125 gp8 family phage protein